VTYGSHAKNYGTGFSVMQCVESGQQAANNDSQESAASIFRAVTTLLTIEVAGSGKMLTLTHHAEYIHITEDSNLSHKRHLRSYKQHSLYSD
jgi:hypothetical protein